MLLGETIREGFDGQYYIDGTLHEISLLEIGKVVALTVQVVLPKVDRSHLKKVKTFFQSDIIEYVFRQKT